MLPQFRTISLISFVLVNIRLFEKRMGNIDQAVPFFGSEFLTEYMIYPLIMVVYTLLVACNFFDRIIDFFGSWKRFRFQTEADDMDGFDPSGSIVLQKERSWIEQGLKVGEHVIPLARNFNSTDVETGSNNMERTHVELKATTSLGTEGANGTSAIALRDESRIRYGSSEEAISNKYAAIRDQSRQSSSNTNQNISAAKVSLLDEGNSNPDSTAGGLRTGLSSKWESMKNGFRNFKANTKFKIL